MRRSITPGVVAGAVLIGVGVGYWAALLAGPSQSTSPNCRSGFGAVYACAATHASPKFAPWLCVVIGACAAAVTVIGWLATRRSGSS
jgi:hypothetical protein